MFAADISDLACLENNVSRETYASKPEKIYLKPIINLALWQVWPIGSKPCHMVSVMKNRY